MNHEELQLKQALAKMLPEELVMVGEELNWHDKSDHKLPIYPVLYSQLLHVCHLIEKKLIKFDYDKYLNSYIRRNMDVYQNNGISATWQQRAKALQETLSV